MNNTEYRNELLADCEMSACDCKGNADYAAYAFKKKSEAEGREYVKRLDENLARLKTYMSMLDRTNAKIASGEA